MNSSSTTTSFGKRRNQYRGERRRGRGAARSKPAVKKDVEEAALPAKPLAQDAPGPARKSDDERRDEALDLVVETVEALVPERGGEEKIWGSMVKQALKRRKPGFNESYFGFRSFNGLLEEAQRRGSLKLDRDEKSGGYTVRLVAPEE